jgi:hypothetical protein
MGGNLGLQREPGHGILSRCARRMRKNRSLCGSFYAQLSLPQSVGLQLETKTVSDAPDNSKVGSIQISRTSKPDFNRSIYYKNSLEFSFETGWHPVNIPFVYDFAVGGGYNMNP